MTEATQTHPFYSYLSQRLTTVTNTLHWYNESSNTETDPVNFMALLQCLSILAHLLVCQSTLQLKPHTLHLMQVLHCCNTFLFTADKLYQVAQKMSHWINAISWQPIFFTKISGFTEEEFSTIRENFTELKNYRFTIFYSVFQNYTEEMDSHC